MQFIWDENKNKRNKAKYGVSFETAKLIFNDPHHISLQDRHEGGEERWQTLGLVGGIVVLLVAHTIFEKKDEVIICIISARKAKRHERQCYEQSF